MKNIILFLILAGIGFDVSGQASKRDSIANEVNAYVQTVNRAATIFLDRQRPTEERIKAIAPHAIIYDEGQVEQFKRVVISNDERPEIRAMALNKICIRIQKDDALYKQVVDWFANPQTPKVLRDATLDCISNLSFSAIVGVLDVYPKMVTDPDTSFRVFAISKLVANDDARTKQLLTNGLQNPVNALVPPALAIQLLDLAPKKDYYPAVYKVLLETKDDEAKLAAIQALGSYREARQRLIAISRDPNEKEEFRISALLSLSSGDKDNIVTYVTPILQDKSATPKLQSTGIQMSINSRKTMAYRKSKKAQKADDYDRMIRDIAQGRGASTHPDVRDTANKYLLLVRPNF
jgi:hypothetical protein